MDIPGQPTVTAFIGILTKAGNRRHWYTQAYSFLKKHSNGKSFNIHRLVYLATSGWLRIEEELRVWQSEAVKGPGESLPGSARPTGQRGGCIYHMRSKQLSTIARQMIR